MKLIAYFRVSTGKQGASGARLDAQRAGVEAYASQVHARITKTFTEVDSSKNHACPELTKAIRLARVTGATLAIAKLDRPSRNAPLLLTLRDSGIRCLAADMPDTNELTAGIMALVAQQEREAISRRTQEALAAARRRGKCPKGARAPRRAKQGHEASLAAVNARADQHAEGLRPVVKTLAQEGVTSLAAIAAQLNEREMLTPRGSRWCKSSVRNLLARLAA